MVYVVSGVEAKWSNLTAFKSSLQPHHPLQRVKAKWNRDFRFGGKSAAASNKASHAASKSLLFSFVLDTFQAISVIFLTVQAHEEEYQTSGFVGEENL